MYCSQCGTQVPDASTFCHSCGAAIAKAVPPARLGGGPAATGRRPSFPVLGAAGAGIVVGIVLLALLIAGPLGGGDAGGSDSEPPDPCALLSTAEVGNVLGAPVRPVPLVQKPVDEESWPLRQALEYIKWEAEGPSQPETPFRACTWVPDLPADRGSNKRVTIGVRTGVSRQDFKDQMKSAADTIDFRFKEDPKFKKVSGVGDMAFFEDRTLHALKGDIEVVVYVDTGEEIPSPGLLWGPEQWRRYIERYIQPHREVVVQLARKAVARLP